ncbi:MAG TPA: HAMP domain-containing sensor histidine kinase, partial [Bacteroidales bacterium]|nr:HAMP domain-containing sensor histidine kinase [Bacteroidales bacterium]
MVSKGIGMSLTRHGIVEKVWYNSFGADKLMEGETPFIRLIDSNSRQKAMTLLQKINSGQGDFGCQLDVLAKNEILTLDFGGFKLSGKMLLFGVEHSKETTTFMNYLQQINNEHVNTIRSLKKEQSLYQNEKQSEQKDDELLIDEISRLNNEMANVQRELTKNNMELERVNKLKNTFLGMAAHDLRNPLNVIISYADFIIDEAAESLEPDHLDFLKRIVRSSDYMLGLIENLLDYSKIEEGRLDLSQTEFDIVALAVHSVQANNVLATTKEVNISFSSNVDKLMVKFDYLKMEQVFNNLLSNAVKFSYPGAKVEFILEKHKQNL